MTDPLEQQHSDDLVLLYGTWYEIRRRTEGGYDHITFQRQDPTQMGWGQQFVFESNGTFADIYSARCGNDEAIHHWSGRWQLDVATRSLKLTADWASPEKARFCRLNPYPDSQLYTIEELKRDLLVLRQSLPTDAAGNWSLR